MYIQKMQLKPTKSKAYSQIIDYISQEYDKTPKSMMLANRICIRILLAIIKKLGQNATFNGANSLTLTFLVLERIKKYSESNMTLIRNPNYNFDSSTVQII
jgi:hypothetical protein